MKRGRVYQRKGGSIWWLQYWFNGEDRRESSRSTNEKVARKLLTARMAGKDNGTLAEGALKPLKWEDLAGLIEGDYLRKENRSLERLQSALLALGTMFAGWRASAITDAKLNEYFKARLALGKARATVKYELTVLRRAFKLAKLPVPSFDLGPINNARQGFFEDAEFRAVLAQLPVHLQPVMTVARLTSWRAQSELLPMQWPQIDWKAGVMKLDAGTTKNGESRVYPFGAFPELLAVLKRQRELADQIQRERQIIIPWVFFRVTATEVRPIKSYKNGWNAATARAGVPGKLVHDFRRTGVRHLRQSGVPESVAMKLSGHKTRSIFLRYDIVDDKDLTIGVQQLAKFHAEGGLQDNYGTIVPMAPAGKKVSHG